MSINSRVKELRLHLGLNQTEFGKRLGLGQTAISQWEVAGIDIPGSTLLLICSVYNVSEAWLRDGVGEMFTSQTDDDIALLAQKLGLDELTKTAFRCFMMLDEKKRAVMSEYLELLINEYTAGKSIETAAVDMEVARELTPEELHEQLDIEIELEKSKKMSEVFPDTGLKNA